VSTAPGLVGALQDADDAESCCSSVRYPLVGVERARSSLEKRGCIALMFR